ncbi:hypothetical protein [Mitsuokella multacida]|uniref:Uncharacterized protein n=1 Tax=Mitsuokella multacida TaxID=52226 RepID=A0A414NVW8_9FIRM|nr:hypothetical protein [Mitsuokella multacida]MBP7727112.1 hypothetical protein [Mitsuokella sp.]MCF2584996.1 hypothetical protein [Mitsuokella multacida]MDO5582888.1 hypothetical protein [Mitsuokella multacida]RHF51142.1 hypothetical protein DW674_08625 [Mitsuokella multacida]
MLESGTRICPFCGEPATLAASPVVEGLPELVLLNELAPVPATREETLAELHRLESYFGELDTKYATLADLWLKSACWQAPSKTRWAVGGFLLALLLYLLVGIHLPAMAAWIFVVLWGVIAYFGFTRSYAHYEAGRSENEHAIRELENEIRRHYNKARDCFLPLDYTAPSVLSELIAGLDSGMIASFEDYRINN